jgi:hypothetical protein
MQDRFATLCSRKVRRNMIARFASVNFEVGNIDKEN